MARTVGQGNSHASGQDSAQVCGGSVGRGGGQVFERGVGGCSSQSSCPASDRGVGRGGGQASDRGVGGGSSQSSRSSW
ncbi:hypothetical protein HanPSC8_Chr05g0187631 [Helianthus annuus]|nr:hypothetical protein HanPSC8_Chr05g0187631 [Helianthus annuus]